LRVSPEAEAELDDIWIYIAHEVVVILHVAHGSRDILALLEP